MQKVTKWMGVVFMVASLCVSCSDLTDSKGKLLTIDDVIGQTVTPGQVGTPSWQQLEGKHEMDVFVLMGSFKQTTMIGYDKAWKDDGTAEYKQTVTIIKNPDGKTFRLLMGETKFGQMPLALLAVFPKVTLAVRADKTITFKSLENGFAGFASVVPPPPITEEDWKDIEKLKTKVQVWGDVSSIRAENSEVWLDSENKLVCKIDVNWNLKKETIHAANEVWKNFAPMFENVKSASTTKGKYKGVFDRKKHGTVASGGILEVVRINSKAEGRFAALPVTAVSRNLPPCEAVTVEIPSDVVPITAAQLVALPFLGSRSCLHSRGTSYSNVKTLKNQAEGLSDDLYENTVSWNFAVINNTCVFTSEHFKIGNMPFSGTMKVTVPLNAIKKSGTSYYFDGCITDTAASCYTVSALWLTSSGAVTEFKAAFDTQTNNWLMFTHVVDTVQMLVPVNVDMQIHSRGGALL